MVGRISSLRISAEEMQDCKNSNSALSQIENGYDAGNGHLYELPTPNSAPSKSMVRRKSMIKSTTADLHDKQLHQPKATDDDGRPPRTGNMWTASAHVITAVIGSGVLSLAWSMAQLGWIAGPPVLLAFALVTYYASLLLADCYRSPDSETGTRSYTYIEAVKANLGGVNVWICGAVQYTNLVGTAIGYTITASISMVAIGCSNCFYSKGRHALCHISNNPYMALFGVIQLVLSQIPDFSSISFLSIIAATMSFSYSLIGLGLGIAKTIENGRILGTATSPSIGGIGQMKKIWQIFQAFGNIAFAYTFSNILIEIQDTLKSPPTEKKTMNKATLMGISTTTMFYLTVGCFGYSAFGNDAPGNLLTGFGFYNPFWLVDIANACIVVHLIGAYQVYSQPLFAFVEEWAANTWPKTKILHKDFAIKNSLIGPIRINPFRLVWRSTFVIFTVITSMLLPFFNDIVGLLGAFSFWPLTIYFPVTMYISKSKLRKWSCKWIGMQILNAVCLLVSIAAIVGSLAGIFKDLKNYTPFKTTY